MRFIGTIGFDNGGFDLHSRTTQEMSFTEGAEWYLESLKYFSVMVHQDRGVQEIIVTLWDAANTERPDAEPVAQEIFRKE